MPLGKNKPTIAVDFDGVIHRYSKGWHDGTAYDEPMEGAREYLARLVADYAVYIFSTRPKGQILDWLAKWIPEIPAELIDDGELYWTKTGVLGVANHKVVAYVWLDDRAVRYEGNWERAYMSIQNIVAGRPIAHDGETSDGYHTFHELYRHRYVLFVAIARAEAEHLVTSLGVSEKKAAEKVWCSLLHDDGTMFDDSFIVGMQLPTGQVSYHLPMKEWDRVSKIIPVLERAPKWDGHTPADVLTRLEKWVYGE